MRPETVEMPKEHPADEEPLVARCARLERAYDDLMQRLRRYERERAEIRARLERLLALIAVLDLGLP
jgi:predicted nuclease with TOPRIM domain